MHPTGVMASKQRSDQRVHGNDGITITDANPRRAPRVLALVPKSAWEHHPAGAPRVTFPKDSARIVRTSSPNN